ncbi:MAG TPA: T9SS type A sorting domain-containing protein [Bacteroidales bacterium]|nr:T9SS type A sorting domain-containing protein [Bacteroidales bacterium]
MKSIILFIQSIFVASTVFGQGLVNNGAYLSITSAAVVTLDGTGGNLTNSGTIDISGKMYVNGNWTNNATINAAGSTIFMEGTTAQTIGGTSPTTFHNLTMQNTFSTSPQIALGINANVENQLTIDPGNNVSLSTYTLTLGKDIANPGELLPVNGSNQYQGGYLITGNGGSGGSMKRWYKSSVNSGDKSGLFPFGVAEGATLYNRYLLVEFTAAPTGGSLTSYFNKEAMIWPASWLGGNVPWVGAAGSCPNFFINSLSDKGYWQTDANDGLANGQYTISLRGDGLLNAWFMANPNLCYLTAVKAKTYNNGGSVDTWSVQTAESGTHVVASGSAANPLVQRSSVSSGFSKWGLAGGGPTAPLPIELLSFKAVCVTNGVSLKWNTATETNNNYFNVERSHDAANWTVIAQIPGAGNSNQITNYSYTDEMPANTSTYYRLKQTDFDGAHEYFNPVAVNCVSDGENMVISVYPNPFKEIINIEITNFAYPHAQIHIYDVIGKIISIKDFSTSADKDIKTSFDLRKLASGVYFVEVSANELKKNFKIVKN